MRAIIETVYIPNTRWKLLLITIWSTDAGKKRQTQFRGDDSF